MVLVHIPPVFICGIARSGTSLLAGLLDGHPALAVLPNETYCYRELALSRWITKAGINAGEFCDLEGLVWLVSRPALAPITMHGRGRREQRLREWAAAFGKDGAPPVGHTLGPAVNAGRRTNPWPSFLAVYEQRASATSVAAKYWVEKTPMNERFVVFSERIFGKTARYLHVVRDPRAVLASWMKAQILYRIVRPRVHELVTVCHAWARSVYQGVANTKRCPGRYFIIRYEDLVQGTRGTGERVSRILDIDYSPSLEIPTSLGGATISNSSFGDLRGTTVGVVATQVRRFAEELTESEISAVESLLGAQMKAIGYEESRISETRNALVAQVWDRSPLLRAKRWKTQRYQKAFAPLKLSFEKGVWPAVSSGPQT